MSTRVDNVWTSRVPPPKLVEKGDCAAVGAADILRLSRRGSQRHQRLHQWSGGGSFGTFPCPGDVVEPAPPFKPSAARSDDLRRSTCGTSRQRPVLTTKSAAG